MILLYTFSTPLGTAIGVACHDIYNGQSATALVVTGVLDAAAAGVLVYDALVNILSTHMSSPLFEAAGRRLQLLQMACLWTGAAIMSIIGIYA